MSALDFDKVPDGHELTLKVEKSEEAADAFVRRLREIVLMICAVGGAAIFLWICFQVVTDPKSSADDKKWATSIITAVVGGLVGALVKR